MANSKKSQPNNRSGLAFHPLTLQFHTFLKDHLKPQQRLLLALSGGLDSCVLLHLLADARPHFDFQLQAMHVHHGLSPNADVWAALCVKICTAVNVSCEVVKVTVPKDSGLGIENTARRLRYKALFSGTPSGEKPDFVVTAHHQDDQAETLLLQLVRGAGVKGLSAMAVGDLKRKLLRPLLHISRQTMQNYAEHHKVAWCDDESNLDTHYERNFIRHEVLPILESRYPAIKSTIARTASHIAEANSLLDELAALDISGLDDGRSLGLPGLTNLSAARAKNGLRWWFAKNGLAMPTADHLQEILNQLLDAKPDAKLAIQLHANDFEQIKTLKRYQQRAYIIDAMVSEPYDLLWQGEQEMALPQCGKLVFKHMSGSGLATKFGLSKLRITNRKGGERFKPDANKPTRTLKHLLQEADMPPWQREQLPLVYWQDTLAYVPGIGIAHELKAAESELGLEIEWQRT